MWQMTLPLQQNSRILILHRKKKRVVRVLLAARLFADQQALVQEGVQEHMMQMMMTMMAHHPGDSYLLQQPVCTSRMIPPQHYDRHHRRGFLQECTRRKHRQLLSPLPLRRVRPPLILKRINDERPNIRTLQAPSVQGSRLISEVSVLSSGETGVKEPPAWEALSVIWMVCSIRYKHLHTPASHANRTLSDASISQSALEDAYLSNMQRGASASRMSTISQAIRSRYL